MQDVALSRPLLTTSGQCPRRTTILSDGARGRGAVRGDEFSHSRGLAMGEDAVEGHRCAASYSLATSPASIPRAERSLLVCRSMKKQLQRY